MSANLRLFTRCVYAFDAVVQRTDAGRWGDPSPCDGWTAADVVRHQCEVLHAVVLQARYGEVGRPVLPAGAADLPPAELWAVVRDDLLDALDHLGVLHRQGPFWFEAPTIDDLVAMVAWDPCTHAWDLAEATGVAHGLPDDLLAAVLPTVEGRRELLVSSGRVADLEVPPGDAPLLDRYLALVGRTPG